MGPSGTQRRQWAWCHLLSATVTVTDIHEAYTLLGAFYPRSLISSSQFLEYIIPLVLPTSQVRKLRPGACTYPRSYREAMAEPALELGLAGSKAGAQVPTLREGEDPLEASPWVGRGCSWAREKQQLPEANGISVHRKACLCRGRPELSPGDPTQSS